MSIGNRIKNLRAERGYTQTEFAGKLNLSQSVLSLIEADRSSLTIDTIRKICEIFNINSHWLIYGKPPFLKDLDMESFIPLIKQPNIDNYLTDRVKSADEQKWPYYSVPGFAGKDLKIFEVLGDSMLPTLSGGDLVICQKVNIKSEAKNGGIYFCVTGEELLLRRLYFKGEDNSSLRLESDNGDFDPVTLPVSGLEEAWRVISKISGSFNDSKQMEALRLQRMEIEMADLRRRFEEAVKSSDRGSKHP